MPSKGTKTIRIFRSDASDIELLAATEGISVMQALNQMLNQTRKTPSLFDFDKGVWICPFDHREFNAKSQLIQHFQEVEMQK